MTLLIIDIPRLPERQYVLTQHIRCVLSPGSLNQPTHRHPVSTRMISIVIFSFHLSLDLRPELWTAHVTYESRIFRPYHNLDLTILSASEYKV